VGAPREEKGFEEKFGCEMGISVDDLFEIMFLFFVQLPKFNCVLRNVYFAYCGSNMQGGECLLQSFFYILRSPQNHGLKINIPN
jgi:hypothetical protein